MAKNLTQYVVEDHVCYSCHNSMPISFQAKSLIEARKIYKQVAGSICSYCSMPGEATSSILNAKLTSMLGGNIALRSENQVHAYYSIRNMQNEDTYTKTLKSTNPSYFRHINFGITKIEYLGGGIYYIDMQNSKSIIHNSKSITLIL